MSTDPKEFAKLICKLLRKNGVRAGNVRGDGTSNPKNPYEAYFVWDEPSSEYIGRPIYLHFRMHDGTSTKLKSFFDDNKIPYWWDGEEIETFHLLPFDIRVCEKCKAQVRGAYTWCSTCVDKADRGEQ